MNRAVKESLTVGAPAVRERPILFSAPMVRAIREDRKTQTRRVAKPGRYPSLLNGEWSDSYVLDPGNREWLMRDCPYGAPGDRLWVRETWGLHAHLDYTYWLRDSIRGRSAEDLCGSYEVAYAADATSPYDHWRPSIFMPRWASRITLDVVSVRVERLNSISEEDAVAEGIERGADVFQCPTWKDYLYLPGEEGPAWFPDDPIGSFRSLWESVNGLGSWDANPWVWVVEFERCREAA